MKKRFWNRKELASRLAIKAYLAKRCLYYAQPLNLAQLQVVTGLDWTKLKTLTLVKNKKLSPQTILKETELHEICLELDFDCQAQPQLDLYTVAQNYFQTPHQHLWKPKPPVVTIMGHVDHGKTTLLDTLRHSQLVASEAGQITQKMAAYQLLWKTNPITLLDTPGHKLFRLMREQGSQVTDLIILVIAANEGVKAQTIEAIQHAKASQVPLIVFLNKVDLPHLQIEAIKTTLTKYNLTPREWGGTTPYFSGSATQAPTLAPLLDAIIAFRDQAKLRFCLKCLGQGTVLEAYQTRTGYWNQVLLTSGSLVPQTFLLANNGANAKLRLLQNDRHRQLSQVTAGMATALTGFATLLPTGTKLYAFPQRDIIDFINEYKTVLVSQKLFFNRQKPQLEHLWTEQPLLHPTNFIVKVDSKGSEATLRPVLDKLSLENLHFKLIKLATGPFTNQDFHLAITSHAHLLLFNLSLDPTFTTSLKMHSLTVRQFNLLHELIAFLTKFEKLNQVTTSLERLGEAKVIRVFDHSKLGSIAGCVVTEGSLKVSKTTVFHHFRNEKLLSDQLEIKSMQQERTQIKQAQTNQEIGIIFKTPATFALNDRLVQFNVLIKKKPLHA